MADQYDLSDPGDGPRDQYDDMGAWLVAEESERAKADERRRIDEAVKLLEENGYVVQKK